MNPHDWHKRPIDCGKEGPCTVCGCPAPGTRKTGTYHRATLEAEGFSFRFIIRKRSAKGWQHVGLCPLPRAPAEKLAQPEARGQKAAQPEAKVSDPSNPGDTTLALMARAAMLHAMGKPFPKIDKAMQLKRRTVNTWKLQWPEHWELACHSARAQLVKMVKAQIGTPAVLEDVDAHLERAKFAESIGALPRAEEPTVCTFFESYVLPTCFYGDKPVTVDTYRNALKLWRLITGDPPLESVTTETLTLFRDALSKRRGLQSYTRAASDTVASRLRSIQTILDKAGPPGRRNRDAKGLIPSPPWIRAPKAAMKLPRVLSPETFKVVYDATAGMDRPWVPGIKPPAWWKALLVVTYNTQLRRRTLFEMRMDEIDWGVSCLRLPAARLKGGRPMIVHLNAAALDALRKIRRARELVFPTDWADEKTFYKWFHHLQDSAGIPRKEHFGLHVIRKTAATVLAGFSPQAAQLALGHRSLTTTVNHYINPTSIVAAALDAMPQPFGATTP
jgi:integrase